MYNSASVCSLNNQARVLCPQYAAKDYHRFLVGTCSLHDSNELSILQYFEDSNHFDVSCSFAHPDQIWAIEASPKDSALVVTSRQSLGARSLTLWRMPQQDAESLAADPAGGDSFHNEQLELTEIASFCHTQKAVSVRDIKWSSTEDTLLTIDNKMLSTWTIGEGSISLDNGLALDDESQGFLQEGCVAWDPHNSKQCAVGLGRALRIVDTREMEITSEQIGAHEESIRSVDYNPNKPLMLITAGDDRKVKFWDARNFNKPVQILAGHSHWVWSAKFNPFHDQLVISGGSDHVVNLWRVASCSSAPWLGSEEASSDPADAKVRASDQHEDSVYSVAWSAADAWIYCSLSFDGRAMISHVPSTEKYKILL
ncbi:hypothetical protein B484DRAFT_447906 [Ochromonadaceae sp. CCMP2298]|nr:hypothetical protein B484DRAFT_447906 [Ochromonadaceae sp. CCMP2298]